MDLFLLFHINNITGSEQWSKQVTIISGKYMYNRLLIGLSKYWLTEIKRIIVMYDSSAIYAHAYISLQPSKQIIPYEQSNAGMFVTALCLFNREKVKYQPLKVNQQLVQGMIVKMDSLADNF